MAEGLYSLREVSGVGGFRSARSVRAELLESAGATVDVVSGLEFIWAATRKALADAAWTALAVDPSRWRNQFVAERLESPVTGHRNKLPPPSSATPPERFYRFGDTGSAGAQRAIHIPGEDVVGLTVDRIETGLDGALPESLTLCAARWRYLGWLLDRSVEPVSSIIDARCADSSALSSTGLVAAVDVTRQVAAQWMTIGNATHGFALGLRRAQTSIRYVQSERSALIARSQNSFEVMVHRPVLEETLERRARTEFAEAYGAGLFAFVCGMRSAGEPQMFVSGRHYG